MPVIKKIDGSNLGILNYMYAFVKMNCAEYEDLDKNIYLECRDSIYTSLDTYYTNLINGIIGCRRVNMDDIEIDVKLKYHCKPYNIVYNIEFLHYFYTNNKFDIVGNYQSESKFIEDLISACIADKNDAFILYRPKCPTGKNPEEHDVLINLGFELVEYSMEREIFTYMHTPKTQ